MNNPLVTCICPTTAARREWLPKAIDCFRRQTYENRHLLILADRFEDVEGLASTSDKITIAAVVGESMRIGVKRNLACGLAAGADIIAHWDDDDFSEPGRLADQVHTLEQTGKAVTGYHSMLFTDGADWWRYQGTPAFALGTSLCYRRAWWIEHPFPNMAVCEDSGFGMEALQARQLVAVDDRGLIYATIHPGNTSPRRINPGSNWEHLPGFEWKAAA